MMLHHEKPENLQPINSSVWSPCENMWFKYQVTLIMFGSFLLSNEILKDTKKFW